LGLGIASACLGGLGVAFNFACCFGWASMPFSAVGVVLGGIGLVVAHQRRHGWALPIAGASISTGALVLSGTLMWMAAQQAARSTQNVADLMKGVGNIVESAGRIHERQIAEQEKRKQRQLVDEEQARQSVITFLHRIEMGQFQAAHESGSALFKLQYPAPKQLEELMKDHLLPDQPEKAGQRPGEAADLKRVGGSTVAGTCDFEYRRSSAPMGKVVVYSLTASKEGEIWKISRLRVRRVEADPAEKQR
jgi:hypothetical protein